MDNQYQNDGQQWDFEISGAYIFGDRSGLDRRLAGYVEGKQVVTSPIVMEIEDNIYQTKNHIYKVTSWI